MMGEGEDASGEEGNFNYQNGGHPDPRNNPNVIGNASFGIPHQQPQFNQYHGAQHQQRPPQGHMSAPSGHGGAYPLHQQVPQGVHPNYNQFQGMPNENQMRIMGEPNRMDARGVVPGGNASFGLRASGVPDINEMSPSREMGVGYAKNPQVVSWEGPSVSSNRGSQIQDPPRSGMSGEYSGFSGGAYAPEPVRAQYNQTPQHPQQYNMYSQVHQSAGPIHSERPDVHRPPQSPPNDHGYGSSEPFKQSEPLASSSYTPAQTNEMIYSQMGKMNWNTFGTPSAGEPPSYSSAVYNSPENQNQMRAPSNPTSYSIPAPSESYYAGPTATAAFQAPAPSFNGYGSHSVHFGAGKPGHDAQPQGKYNFQSQYHPAVFSNFFNSSEYSFLFSDSE